MNQHNEEGQKEAVESHYQNLSQPFFMHCVSAVVFRMERDADDNVIIVCYFLNQNSS